LNPNRPATSQANPQPQMPWEYRYDPNTEQHVITISATDFQPETFNLKPSTF
jgi:hypothetical protein